VVQLEAGVRSLDESREYHDWMVARRPKRHRTPGGAYKVGRIRTKPKPDYRGEPLVTPAKAVSALPDGWDLIGIVRTSENCDLAFLFHDTDEIFGMIAFQKDNEGSIVPGSLIQIDSDRDMAFGQAMKDFMDGEMIAEWNDHQESTEIPR